MECNTVDKLIENIMKLSEKVGRLEKENEYLAKELEKHQGDQLFKRRVK
jgi:hypothetical protein